MATFFSDEQNTRRQQAQSVEAQALWYERLSVAGGSLAHTYRSKATALREQAREAREQLEARKREHDHARKARNAEVFTPWYPPCP
jgi:hypothetical protein